MAIEVWQAALGAMGTAAAGGGLGGFWSRRSGGERDANSAVMLAKAYGELIDDQRSSLTDARAHIHRQDEEIRGLRDELRAMREAREVETGGLRVELAAARAESVAARQESASLREELRVLRVGSTA